MYESRPRVSAGLDHVLRSSDVHGLQLARGRGEAVQRRDVAGGIAAGDRAAEPIGVEQVDPLVADLGTPLPQLARDVPAHEPVRSRDIDTHPAHDCHMAELPSGTVTLLFTDIEGSTQLLKQRAGEYGEMLAEHQRILRSAFEAHGGGEVDTQGDSFFVAFRRAKDAVAAAVAARTTWPLPLVARRGGQGTHGPPYR